MTRRDLFWFASTRWLTPRVPVVVPVNQIIDTKAKIHPARLEDFRSNIWPEAIRLFADCGIRLDCTVISGEVDRPPYREPVFKGLVDGALNIVITNHVPMQWDGGRALNGVTTMYRGYHLCIIALNWAHGNQLPFLSLNTCVHELLHALLHDIFENRPKGLIGHARELRVDACATRMWLFGEGNQLRDSAQEYVKRLRSEVVRRS